MKFSRFSFGLLLLLILPFALSAQDGAPSTITHDDVERPYYVYVPETYEAGTPAPLVIALHPAQTGGNLFQDAINIDPLAEETGTIVIYPNSQNAFWNYLDVSLEDEDVADDVGFLTALIEQVQQDFTIDEGNISVVGFANGGLMALRLRCELGNQLDSVVMVGASPTFSLVDTCLGTDPLPTMMVLGTLDDTFPWNGSAELGADNTFYSTFGVNQAVPFLAGLNGCNAESAIGAEITSSIGSNRVLAQVNQECADDSQFVLLGIVDFPHRWPVGIGIQLRTGTEGTASQAIWEFLHADLRSPDTGGE